MCFSTSSLLIWGAGIALFSAGSACTGDAFQSPEALTCFKEWYLNFFVYRALPYLSVSLGLIVVANGIKTLVRNNFYGRNFRRQAQPVSGKYSLFLRSFRDDQVVLQGRNPGILSNLFDFGRRVRTLDGVLLDETVAETELVAFRSVQAQGLSEFGAERESVFSDVWRARVAELCRGAQHIYLCLDRTEGVEWEFEHLIEAGHIGKTLFFLHPRLTAEDHAAFIKKIAGDAQADEHDTVFAFFLREERLCKIIGPKKLAGVDAR
jgi:hypothetical protein